MQHRTFWLVTACGVGILQVWDSGTLTAGPIPIMLATAGVLLPAATLWARVGLGTRIGALVVSVALLAAARLAAPVPLNALHVALVPIALYILVVDRIPRASTRTSDVGDGRVANHS